MNKFDQERFDNILKYAASCQKNKEDYEYDDFEGFIKNSGIKHMGSYDFFMMKFSNDKAVMDCFNTLIRAVWTLSCKKAYDAGLIDGRKQYDPLEGVGKLIDIMTEKFGT